MSTDYAKLLQVLAGGGVQFILVGGVAANLHGSARVTYGLKISSQSPNCKLCLSRSVRLDGDSRGGQADRRRYSKLAIR